MALLWPSEARLGRIHYNQMALEWVVQHSEAVVLATAMDPPHTVQQVHLRKVEFSTVVGHFRGDEVLRQGLVEPPERLDVADADLGTQLHVSRLYQEEGVHKSPIYETYGDLGLGAVQPGQQVVLFLRPPPQGKPQGAEDKALHKAVGKAWRLTVQGGMERVERLDQVKALL